LVEGTAVKRREIGIVKSLIADVLDILPGFSSLDSSNQDNT
jgi:hypothetical protein